MKGDLALTIVFIMFVAVAALMTRDFTKHYSEDK